MRNHIRLIAASTAAGILMLASASTASAQTDDIGDVVGEIRDTPLVNSVLDIVAALLRLLGIS